MAKDPSSGRGTGPRQSKARRKGVTIDLDAEEVSKRGTKSSPAAQATKKPAQSASSKASSSKPEPSKMASEPVKAGPLKADAAKGQPAKKQSAGGKAAADTAKIAEESTKSGASGDGGAKKAASAIRHPDREPVGSKSGPARPAQSAVPPTARESQKSSPSASAASRLVAAFAGGIIALGGAVALDRLQMISIFGAKPGLSDLQTQIAGVKQEADGQIADLQAQIAALPATSGTDVDGLAPLGEKITQIEASLAEQGARIAKAEQPQALSDLEARLAGLESAVQSGAAGPDAGLAAIEQKLAGVEESIATVQVLAGKTAGDAAAAVKPEIDRLAASADALTKRVKTLEGGLSGQVDPQIFAALGTRVDQLAGVVDKNASPQSIAALKSALAAESLAAAVVAGRSFAAELQILQSSMDGGPDLTAIAAYAAEGLPDAAVLAAEFEALIPSMLPPEPERPAAPESAGLVDRLMASARNVVEVREAGPAAGGELMRQTGAVLQALTGNNLKAARTAWEALPAEARQASAGWSAKLEARLAADALAGSLRAEALSRLAKAGGGEGQ